MQHEQRRSGSRLNKFMRKVKWNVKIRAFLFGPDGVRMRQRAREVERDIRDEEDVRDYERWKWHEERMILRAYAKQLREQVRELGGTPLAEPPLDVDRAGYTPGSPPATPARVELPQRTDIKPRPGEKPK